MRVSKNELKFTRCKILGFGLLATVLALMSIRGSSNKIGYKQIPQFQKSTPEASIVFKAHFLSVLKGASERSEMSQFIMKFHNSVSGVLENKNSKAGRVASSLLKGMKIYEEKKSLGNKHFWAVLSKSLGHSESANMLSFGGKPLSGSQKKFWKHASESLKAGEDKELLMDAKDGGILNLAANDQETMKVVLAFEKERLASHLTAEDHMFVRILEKKVILGNKHNGMFDWVQGLKDLFNVKNDFKDSSASAPEASGPDSSESESTSPSSTESASEPASQEEHAAHLAFLDKAKTTWKLSHKGQSALSRGQTHLQEGKEFDNGLPESDKPATEASTEEEAPKEETRSEKAKREQAEREKKRDERKQKRLATRARWQAEEAETRKQEKAQLDKLTKGSDEYDELVLKFKNDRKERREKLFHELWGDEEVIAHPGYQ